MTTLFERLGGAPSIKVAVDMFYDRMLADECVARFFEGTDMEQQKKKQMGFLIFVTGGPNAYTGKDMREGHKHLLARGLDDSHVDVVVEHLGQTLAELGVPAEDVGEVAALAESVRDDVLNR